MAATIFSESDAVVSVLHQEAHATGKPAKTFAIIICRPDPEKPGMHVKVLKVPTKDPRTQTTVTFESMRDENRAYNAAEDAFLQRGAEQTSVILDERVTSGDNQRRLTLYDPVERKPMPVDGKNVTAEYRPT